MRKGLVLIVPLFFLWGASAAMAQSVHFSSASASIDSSGALVISFHEAGLAKGTTNYVAGAYGIAEYGCVNKGGHHPKATNKTEAGGVVAGDVTLKIRHNGTFRGSISIGPPPPPSGLSCEHNMTVALISITYESMTTAVSDELIDYETAYTDLTGEGLTEEDAGEILNSSSPNIFFEDEYNDVDGSYLLGTSYTYCNATYASYC